MGFVDHFFWAMAALATAGAFLDFLIGKRGVERFHDALETWWIKLNDVRWRNFGRKEAEMVVAYIDRRTGTFFSSQRWRLIIWILVAAWGLVFIWLLARTAIGGSHAWLSDWLGALIATLITMASTTAAISLI